MKEVVMTLCMAMLAPSVWAVDFSECYEYLKHINSNSPEPTLSEDGRRADWVVDGSSIGCRVDAGGRVVSLITPRGEMLRHQLVKVKGASAGKPEFAAEEDDEFVKKAIAYLKSSAKDASSVQLRGLFLSDQSLPTLCGEINGKNAYGGFTGFKRFYYTGRPGLNSVEGRDDIFPAFYPKVCGAVRKEVEAPMLFDQSKAPSVSVADELEKLHGLRKKGILSENEYESQKKKLLGY